MYELLIRLDASFERLIYKYGRPSAAVRYWAPTVTGAIVAYILGSTLAVRWDDVVNWIEDLQDTAKSFLTEWILKPLKNIYTTVRHKEARLAITSNESLNADLEVGFLGKSLRVYPMILHFLAVISLWNEWS